MQRFHSRRLTVFHLRAGYKVSGTHRCLMVGLLLLQLSELVGSYLSTRLCSAGTGRAANARQNDGNC